MRLQIPRLDGANIKSYCMAAEKKRPQNTNTRTRTRTQQATVEVYAYPSSPRSRPLHVPARHPKPSGTTGRPLHTLGGYYYHVKLCRLT